MLHCYGKFVTPSMDFKQIFCCHDDTITTIMIKCQYSNNGLCMNVHT